MSQSRCADCKRMDLCISAGGLWWVDGALRCHDCTEKRFAEAASEISQLRMDVANLKTVIRNSQKEEVGSTKCHPKEANDA